ncbi:globin domain-containing protein [Pseudonocardia sp. WMMC193]|uniref:globin domain-containing protein n=1 Tax=Pseudonocardia sp. WMMC193 TaxID=2911965 RepID=UPI001F3B16B2|nr:globin domain-containing protein [Pseudonocardia sp. WMMC193]MCF7550483.1 FAD-binding oxidoreductase [Pseudonocardia sp. WMMC193]
MSLDDAAVRASGLEEIAPHLQTAQRSVAALGIDPETFVPRFYRTLFGYAPGLRSLFPLSMETQHSRFGRALVHVVTHLDEPSTLIGFLAQLGRDHRKFDVRDEHYAVVGQALLVALADTGGAAWTDEVARAWAHTYAFLAGSMQAGARSDPGPAWWGATVVGHERVERDLAVVRVRTDEPFAYRAGQYVTVETPQHPRLWRALSPAVAPDRSGELEFHVRAIGYGSVSRGIVASARPGDRWRIGPPMGALDRAVVPGRELLMIGGGTGISPIRALVEQLERAGGRPERAVVFYGARDWDSLHALDGLRRTSYRNPWLDVVPVVEEPPAVPGPLVGRLADVVTGFGSWADCEVVVSGSPAMITATIRALRVAGASLDQIHYDPFVTD